MGVCQKKYLVSADAVVVRRVADDEIGKGGLGLGSLEDGVVGAPGFEIFLKRSTRSRCTAVVFTRVLQAIAST